MRIAQSVSNLVRTLTKLLSRIHASPSRLLFLFCIGVGLGIGFASWLSIVPIVIVAIACLGLLFWFTRSIPKRDRALLIGVFVIGMLIGAGRYWSVGPGTNSIANEVYVRNINHAHTCI